MKNKLIMDNDWTKDLSKRLEEHRLDGFAPGMWPDIEKAVLAQQAAKKRRLVWLRRTAAVTAAAAAVAAVVWLSNGTSDVARQVQSAVSRQPLAAASTAQPAANGVGAASSTAAMPAAIYAHRPAMSQQPVGKKAEPQPILAESAAVQPAAAAAPDTALAAVRQPESQPAKKKAESVARANGTYNAASEAALPQPRHSANKWSVGLYAFNSPSKISLGDGGDDGSVMANGKLHDAFYGDANAVAPSIGVADVEMHHKQPVSFGATARYKMNRWLSVEAGLAYTYLSADYADEYMSCEQRLHYVGVPVKLNCDLYSGHRIDVYVTAGIMAEKLVSGRRKTVYPAAPSHNVNSDVREGGLQWSVKGALGFAFNATPSMAVYVEPGVGHYIDNGTHVQNFYKSSPTCFNLLVGIRFTPTR